MPTTSSIDLTKADNALPEADSPNKESANKKGRVGKWLDRVGDGMDLVDVVRFAWRLFS